MEEGSGVSVGDRRRQDGGESRWRLARRAIGPSRARISHAVYTDVFLLKGQAMKRYATKFRDAKKKTSETMVAEELVEPTRGIAESVGRAHPRSGVSLHGTVFMSARKSARRTRAATSLPHQTGTKEDFGGEGAS